MEEQQLVCVMAAILRAEYDNSGAYPDHGHVQSIPQAVSEAREIVARAKDGDYPIVPWSEQLRASKAREAEDDQGLYVP